jgi:two-component system, NarL family, nitrate/nitrite response regulator NarL
VDDGAWTVALADNEPLFREALADALNTRSELEVVAQAGDGEEALQALRATRPSVAVLDVCLPTVDGPTVFEILAREWPPTRVMFLSSHLDGALIHRLVTSGAAAYLTKTSTRREICDSVVAVAHGRTVLGAEAQTLLVEELRNSANEPPLALSDREQTVLRFIAEGLSAPDIGRRLHLSESTVRTHAQHVYEKLGVAERAAAVAQAMRRGILD